MFMKRKSQAALEFLMTYGWAILVVLVAVGALAYFGVLSPDKFLPAKCTLQSGITCIDHKATATSLVVVLQNSLGFDISLDKISATQCPPIGTGVAGSVQASLSNGGKYTGTLTPCVNSGSKYSGELNVTYTITDTQVQHTNRGDITTRVES